MGKWKYWEADGMLDESMDGGGSKHLLGVGRPGPRLGSSAPLLRIESTNERIESTNEREFFACVPNTS